MRLRLTSGLIALLMTCAYASAPFGAAENRKRGERSAQEVKGNHLITINPWGPTQQAIDAARSNLMKSLSLRPSAKQAKTRLLAFELVDRPKLAAVSEPPDSYRATAFDYKANRALIFSGRFDSSEVNVTESQTQPQPSEEEFEAAVGIIMKDRKLGPALRDNSLTPYRPMPPLINGHLPVAEADRTLAVGLHSKEAAKKHQIVGVNMLRQTVVRYANNAPPGTLASASTCAITRDFQPVTPRGTAGQYQMTISREGNVIWSFLVIRPSVSSGPMGSGVELRDVTYLGKTVLKSAKVPIINVQYLRNTCGPFRDWAYSEDTFQADGTDLAPGIRYCTSPPETSLDSGIDHGNFRGVAIWDGREEVRVVSELDADWYRYASEWIFRDDGVIMPRFGFGSVENSCVCIEHVHNAYWRFDFDVGSSSNTIAEEFNGAVESLGVEAMRPRRGEGHRWVIQNSSGQETCILVPGPADGNSDKYSRGDVWMLRNHSPAEEHDGVTCNVGCDTRANLDPYVSGESVSAQDIVVWYGGHFTHHSHDSNLDTGEHVLGPTIVVQKY
jgi:hypothetical protein